MNQSFYVKEMKSGFCNQGSVKANSVFKKVFTKLFLLFIGINLVVVLLANLFNLLSGTGH